MALNGSASPARADEFAAKVRRKLGGKLGLRDLASPGETESGKTPRHVSSRRVLEAHRHVTSHQTQSAARSASRVLRHCRASKSPRSISAMVGRGCVQARLMAEC